MQRAPVTDDTIARAVRGDRAAREAIVRGLGPLVLGLCRRLSPDPEDAFQAVWERVFRSLDRFDVDGPAKLSTWVATIAHRTLIDGRRVRSRRPNVVPFSAARDPQPDAESQIHGAERKQALERALTELPDELRRVVVSHHLGGLPLAVLAEQESVPVGTLKSRLHRARGLLAQALEDR